MKFIVNLKQYDTDLSEEICTGSMRISLELKLLGKTVYPTYDGTLYRTSKGTYFLVYKGDYDRYYMQILSKGEAKSFIAKNNYSKYVELFGEMEEG